MEPLTSDDRAPNPSPRQVPRGVWWAVALIIVVLAGVALKATSGSTSGSAGAPAKLDPGAAEPPAQNPLLGAVKTPDDLVGRPMPDATLDRFTGGTGAISGYRGTPMVINLWASSCVPCVTEMPDLERVHAEYVGRVAFVGIDSGEGIDLGRGRATSTGVTYDLLSDPQATVAASLGASNIPVTVLVRSDGTIARVRFNGTIDPDDLRAWIDADLLS
jgi:thiol-disulfide isomerase/thioredoxin